MNAEYNIDGYTWADVSASRALGTSYKNDSARTMFVSIQINHEDADSPANYLVGPADPPTIFVGRTGPNGATGATSAGSVCFPVPPRWWYRVNAGAGAPTIFDWAEFS
jgi:hypothetical protein